MKKTLLTLTLLVLLALPLMAGADVAVGMLENASMHALTVHTDDNECIDLAMDDYTEVLGDDGLVLGDRVKVEYDYLNDDDELPTAEEVVVLTSVVGTVKEATMHTVTIETEDAGITTTFAETDDTRIVANKGVTVGKKVEIAFEGGLGIAEEVQSAKVWEIYAEDTLSGEIEKVDDEELHLKAHGTTYVFNIEHAYINDQDATKKGSSAKLYFFGNLDADTHTQQVSVHSVYATEPEPVEHNLSGTVRDITMHQITVHTARGNTYTFKIAGSTKLGGGRQGIGVGDTVKCFYTGELNGRHSTDTAHLNKVTVTKRYEEPHEDPDRQHHVTGKVEDATMNTLTIKSGKHTYLLSIEDGFENELSDGLAIGNRVKVYYTGVLKNSKKLQKVQVTRIQDA